jgi:hypothetical protein
MMEGLELSGWGQIAEYLGVSVRAAQTYERDLGMPVHRMPGPRGRVWALSHELDSWKDGTSKKDPRATHPSLDLVTIAEGVALATTNRTRRSISYMLAGTAVLILVGFASYAAFVPHGPLADFRVQGNDLIGLNAKSKELWRHTFPWALQEGKYAERDRLLHFWLGDLTGNGEQQLVFESIPYKRDVVGTTILCFKSNGQVRWQFQPGRAVIDGGGDHLLPPYFAFSLEVIANRNPADTRIVISSNHYLEHAHQVAFLDINGRVVGEYWHPGHLLHMEQADLDGDGRRELLLAGVNNGNHQATLVVIDPLKLSGVVTPKEMKDHAFELLNMAGAHERAVVLFPRSSISTGQHYTRASAVQVTKERIIVPVAEGTAESDPGFVYELDYALNVVNVVPGSIRTIQRHQELEAQGKLDHPFDAVKECERLKAAVIVRTSN